MRKVEIDKTKLLGFSAGGQALFDTVLESSRIGNNQQLPALDRAAGLGKVEGGIKLVSASQLVGQVKDN